MWGLFILLLTAVPGTVLPELPSIIDLFQPDKLLHVLVFALFFILLVNGFRKEGNPRHVARSAILWAFTVGILFGGVTELIQGWIIPNRMGSPWDFAANVAGCFAGWGVLKWRDSRVAKW